MKTVLVTGATGFLGSYLLEALLKNNYHVVILKRSTSNTWRINHFLEQVKSYDVDIEPIEKPFSEQHIDVVIHTACHYGRNGDSIIEIVESNLMFGLKVLEASLKFKSGTFFNADTLLQKHLNNYTLSKKQFVEWLQQVTDQIQIVNLKIEHMYGPKDDDTKFVSWVINQLKAQVLEIKLTAGEQLRDFIYIDDVVSAFMLILEKTKTFAKFTEFDVGTGTSMSVKEFLETLKSVYEKKHGAIQTQFNFGEIPYRDGEIMSVNVNNTALRDLGWQTKIPLKQGLLNILESEK